MARKRNTDTDTGNTNEETNMSATETRKQISLDDIMAATETVSLDEVPKRSHGGGGTRQSKWGAWLDQFLNSGNEVAALSFVEKGEGGLTHSAIIGGLQTAVKRIGTTEGRDVKGKNSPIKTQLDTAAQKVYVFNRSLLPGDVADDAAAE